jgi:hypothetical protein
MEPVTFELPTKRLGFGVPIAILVAGAACAVAAPIRGDSGMFGIAVLLLAVGGFFFYAPNARGPSRRRSSPLDPLGTSWSGGA